MFYEGDYSIRIKRTSPFKEEQISPVIAFIYSSEVMGEGHIGFLDLFGSYIKSEEIIEYVRQHHKDKTTKGRNCNLCIIIV